MCVSLCAEVSVHTYIRIGVCLSMRAHAYLCACMSVALYMEGGREGIMKRQEEMEGRGKVMFLINSPLYLVPVMFRCLNARASPLEKQSAGAFGGSMAGFGV